MIDDKGEKMKKLHPDDQKIKDKLIKRVDQMKKNKEKCSHCSKLAIGVAIVGCRVYGGGDIKEAKMISIPVCKEHGIESEETNLKNREIASRYVKDFNVDTDYRFGIQEIEK